MEISARGYCNRPETKISNSGKQYSKFTLGVKQKKAAYGDKPEQVTWANFFVTDMGNQTPPQDKSFVEVKGYLTVREYEKDGQKRVSLEVYATQVVSADSNGNAGMGNATPAQPGKGVGTGSGQQAQSSQPPWDEELPF